MKIDDKALIKTKAFINGEWVESDNKETFPVINPATGEVIAEVTSCGSVSYTHLTLPTKA